jgi:hypothetical protein
MICHCRYDDRKPSYRARFLRLLASSASGQRIATVRFTIAGVARHSAGFSRNCAIPI